MAPATILIVDDMEDHRSMTACHLQKGWPSANIIEAPDGFVGYTQALAMAPDVIILDARMPEMDGFELGRRLKSNARTRDIPILMLSAILDVTAERIRSQECGATVCLAKPYDPGELIVTLKNLVERNTRIGCLKQREEQLRKAFEEQLGRIREMELTEKAAGGVAHDFNNLLMLIKGYCDLAKDSLEAGDSPEACLNEVADAARHAAELVQKLHGLVKLPRTEKHALPI